MDLGIYSFGEATPDPETGRTISAHERVQRLLDEIELADQVGLDVYGLGEHHRREFVVSAPVVVLAAAATRTKRIRLTSAVSVISSDDPVRVLRAAGSQIVAHAADLHSRVVQVDERLEQGFGLFVVACFGQHDRLVGRE